MKRFLVTSLVALLLSGAAAAHAQNMALAGKTCTGKAGIVGAGFPHDASLTFGPDGRVAAWVYNGTASAGVASRPQAVTKDTVTFQTPGGNNKLLLSPDGTLAGHTDNVGARNNYEAKLTCPIATDNATATPPTQSVAGRRG